MSESFNSMLVLSGMRIPCYLPRIPRPYYGCSPYPIVCLLCCLFHALYSPLSTLYSVVSAPQAPLSLLRRRLSLCSAGASLSAPQAPLSLLRTLRSLQQCGTEQDTSPATERWSKEQVNLREMLRRQQNDGL